MIILGIQDFHDSSACIMVDGELKALVAEERFSRLKRDTGYPYHSIQFCLKQLGLSPHEIDHVAFASTSYFLFTSKLKTYATFTVDDWFRIYEEYWKPKIYENKENFDIFVELWKDPRFQNLDNYYDFSAVDGNYESIADEKIAREIRLEGVKRHLGINRDKVGFYDHHTCHAYYALFGSRKSESNILIYTLDGGGDKTVSTLFQFSGECMNELARSNSADPSRIYRNISFILGMKGGEHIYKVMGLAPYATQKEFKKSKLVFDDMFTIKNDMICYKDDRKPTDNFFYFREAFKKHRFDGIAAATQHMFETSVFQWFEACQKKYDSRHAVFAGGGAMNVKANMLLADAEFLDDFYVCASPTDDTLCVGACYLAEVQHDPKSWQELKPIRDVYMGPKYERSSIESAIERENISKKFKIHENISYDEIVDLLLNGKVVARFSGRMEYGERALGNRSILADPRNIDIVNKINKQIKYRDFWMPFAPVVLEERSSDYLQILNPNIQRPYMMIAANTTEEGRRELRAAIHPADLTTRPQVLRREHNPEYYDLIKRFEMKTGTGALLNTSFNLHGEPIVCSPEDALDTFIRSELDVLVMEDIAIKRF